MCVLCLLMEERLFLVVWLLPSFKNDLLKCISHTADILQMCLMPSTSLSAQPQTCDGRKEISCHSKIERRGRTRGRKKNKTKETFQLQLRVRSSPGRLKFESLITSSTLRELSGMWQRWRRRPASQSLSSTSPKTNIFFRPRRISLFVILSLCLPLCVFVRKRKQLVFYCTV